MQRLTSLFSFRGRTARLAYWRIRLWTSAVLAVLWIATIFVAMGAGDAAAIPMLLGVPVLTVSLATLVRRLHDRGNGAWWLLAFWGAPSACFIAAQLAMEGNGDGGLLSLSAVVAGVFFELWALVEVGILRGTDGPNRFGPVPAPGRRPARA